MMDSEPERCRRTDGKKWRCYKSVVKDQKYCEGHMHRGRQRSRKLVEGLENSPRSGLHIADMNTLLLASANTCSTAKSPDRVNAASIIINSQHAKIASDTGKTTPSVVNVSSISRKKVNVNSHHSSAFPESINTHYCKCKSKNDSKVDVYNPSSCYSTSASIKAAIASRNLHVDDNGIGSYHSSKVRVISCNNQIKEGHSCPATHAYGFSQESLLQYSPDANCRNPSHDPKNGTETEPMRCKRTDGKQWRCSHNVVHGQKYCEKHMHRGAKKVTQNANPPIVAAAAVAPSDFSDNPFFIAKRSNIDINLNMDPSPSIVAYTRAVNGINQSTSSSCSDATTISD